MNLWGTLKLASDRILRQKKKTITCINKIINTNYYNRNKFWEVKMQIKTIINYWPKN